MSILDDAQAGMNLDTRPQDDLFGHVNGRWLEETEIPSDRSSWGPFVQLADAAEEQVRQIITDLADQASSAGPDVGGEARKIGDLFASFMDEAAIEARGLRLYIRNRKRAHVQLIRAAVPIEQNRSHTLHLDYLAAFSLLSGVVYPLMKR